MYVIMRWHCGTGCLTDFQVAKVFRQFQLLVGYEYGGIQNIDFNLPLVNKQIRNFLCTIFASL